jgi:bifunctional UDP-N-acetylglucosamine pyrophosphorylase / glucosamine-1-phosphate N-acetyltransferase
VRTHARDGRRKLAVVILAMGDCARFPSRRPMALNEAGGKLLVVYVAELALAVAESENVTVAAGKVVEAMHVAVNKTGVQVVETAATPETGDLLVLAGNLPMLRPQTLADLVRAHRAGDVAATLLTLEPGADGTRREARVGVFRTEALREHALSLDVKSAQVLADALRDTGAGIASITTEDSVELWEADSIAELVAIDASLHAAKASVLMAKGVVVYRPDTCVIDADVEVEPGAVIDPFVQLRGNTYVGTRTHIGSYSVIRNCHIGDEVTVLPGCVLTDSALERSANVGPMTHMRPGCTVGEGAHLGAFVETKKTRIGRGAKAGHLAYLGDTEVGAGSNIGAGVITCNYDGAHKHKTLIGEGSFVGSDSTLVAPLTVGAGAYIGAGSCITKDVPPDALALGRAHQVTKEGWAAARRALKQQKS